MSEQTFCEVASSLLPECVMGVDISSARYCRTVGRYICSSGNINWTCEWEQTRLPEPSQVVNFKQCIIEAGVLCEQILYSKEPCVGLR